MANLSNICLQGHAGKDAELSQAGDTSVCRFSLAVKTRTKKGGEWADHTTWWSVTSFGREAEWAGRDVKKGVVVTVVGEATVETWKGKDGTERTSGCVRATRVVVAGKAGEAKPAPAAKPAAPAADTSASSDEAPF